MHEDTQVDYPTLSAFADGDLDGASASKVRMHIRMCMVCREEVQFIRVLGDGLRALPNPKAPPELIDEIFAARPGKTEVVALSVPPRRTLKSLVGGALPSLAASAAALVAIALALTLGADRAMAGSSILTLNKTRNGAMELRYETVSPLAAEPSLRARIRYWVPDSLRFTQTAPGFSTIELSRSHPGRFQGVADLPPGTVYAVATVEDLEAERIDTNRGRFWEFIEKDELGRPTLQGRLYQMLAAKGIGSSRVVEVAERAASEFPDRPEFRAEQLLFTRMTAPSAGRDTVLEVLTERLDRLDSAARQRDPGPLGIHALSLYAGLLERDDLATYWQDELTSSYPRHEYALQAHLRSIALSSVSNREKLNALDRVWGLAPVPAIAQIGLPLSYEIADSVITEIWLDRYASEPVFRDLRLDVEMAEQMIKVPGLHLLAEKWILDRLTHSRDWQGVARPLDQTRANFEIETNESRARLNLYLVRARLARGEVAAAFEAVGRAYEQSWNPEVLLELAKLHRSAGSSDRASQLLALVLVDPVAPVAPYAASLKEWTPLVPTEAQLLAARAAWREQVTSSFLDEPVDLAASLRTPSGNEATLREVTGGALTLVIQRPWPSLAPIEHLDLLEVNAASLEAAGARTLFVAVDHGAESDIVAGPVTSPPFHYDERFEIWDALGACRGSQYFVLDTRGSLRYRGEDLATAIRSTLVLGDDFRDFRDVTESP